MDFSLHHFLEKAFFDGHLSRRERQKLIQILTHMEESRKKSLLKEWFEKILFSWPEDERTRDALFLQNLCLALLSTHSKGPSLSQQVCFSPGDHCAEMILGFIKSSKKKMDLCVFTITDDEISHSILEAHKRGVKIRMITDDLKEEDLGSDIQDFRKAGIPVKTDQAETHMHHKFAIFDYQYLITGSYNWTRSARKQQEDLLSTNDPKIIEEYTQHFERLWQNL